MPIPSCDFWTFKVSFTVKLRNRPIKKSKASILQVSKSCFGFWFPSSPDDIRGLDSAKRVSKWIEDELKYIYKKIQSRLVDSCGGPMICNPLPSLPPFSPIGEGSLRLEGWPNPRTTRVTTRSTSGLAVSSTWDREVGWNGVFGFQRDIWDILVGWDSRRARKKIVVEFYRMMVFWSLGFELGGWSKVAQL